MRSICYLTLLFLTGCASVPEAYWQINRATSERFTYVTDFEKHGVGHYDEPNVTGESRFSGDCEEAASAMKYQLAKIGVPSTRWVITTSNGLHAITCTYDNWCLDINTVPTRRENVFGTFLYEMP